MELSNEVIEGLNDVKTDVNKYLAMMKKLLDNVTSENTETCSRTDCTSERALLGLSSVFAVAVRGDLDALAVAGLLEEHSFSPSDAITIADVYRERRDSLKQQMKPVRGEAPRVLDVDWKLDHVIKSTGSDVAESSGEYCVKLKLDDTADDVLFHCSVQQMQDLVTSLREAAKAADYHSS